MKNKLIIALSLALLIALLVFMVKDFFFRKQVNKNPYAFNLDSIRAGDTSLVVYKEVKSLKTSLDEIHGLALDASGNIFVAGNGGVEILAQGRTSGKVLKIGGNSLCIALSDKGIMYLGMDDHLELWSQEGKKLAEWETFGPESVITSIALSGTSVFVADAGQKVVYHCDNSGKLLNKIGLKDPATGVPGFIIPSPYFDLAISSDGYLWIANPGRHQLEKYDFEGKLLKTWGKATMSMEGFCGCCNPSHFAFIYDSLFVTSEKAIERIKIYNADGSFRSVVAVPDQFDEGTKGLDLAIDKDNRILVLDPVKNLIRIFEPK
jgi:hypothetical protein